MNRYEKQLFLPEISAADQERLSRVKLLMVGAGGLGAPALPYLAGAGIGHITIADADTVDITNLHRQTIFKTADAGRNKANLAAAYIKSLNPEINVTAIPNRICHPERSEGSDASPAPDPSTTALRASAQDDKWDYDIILDGTDNFESKSLLNKISIEKNIPLVSASVEQFSGTAAIFAGFNVEAPCYHCLFPELPIDCKTCVEAGILGTVAGLAGMWQAHLTLCYLLGIGDTGPGTILSFDFRSMRMQHLKLQKDPNCPHCQPKKYAAPHCVKDRHSGTKPSQEKIMNIELIHPDDLKNHVIIDVRTNEEVANDPIPGALHIQLDTIPARYNELPKDKLLAFACASNVRSRRAAEYLYGLGYENVCVMDRLV